MAADPDVRTYVRYAALRPRLWRPQRPDLTPHGIEYPDDAGDLPLRFTAPRPLEWFSLITASAEADLRLASTTLKAARFDALPWRMHFEDLENESSLHRFAWLLPWMLEQRRQGTSASSLWERAAAAMRDWIRAHPGPTASEAWQSYTLSERLVNWIIATLALGSFPPGEDVMASITTQAEHLSGSLEHYGPLFTGNHLSNNGRALYFAGIVAERLDLASVGRVILRHERARLFSRNGFLREGSAHYQFLVTRNYAEVLWLAETCGDVAFRDELRVTLPKLRGACEFFLVQGAKPRIPLIGDLSPDCTPEWLLGVASEVREGWREFFPEAGWAAQHVSETSEWARVDSGGWAVIAHVNPRGAPLVPSHAHHDTGGITAFLDGEPVIVDCGRKHYMDDAVGRFGLSGWAHSLLMVDGLNPEPRDRWFLARDFLQRRIGARPEIVAADRTIRITHHGYQRSPGVGVCSREVAVTNDELCVVDSVAGSGFHRLALVFHLPNGTARGSSVEFRAGDKTITLQLPADLRRVRAVTASDDGTFGWATPRYGKQIPVTSVIAEARVRLPWRGASTFRIHP